MVVDYNKVPRGFNFRGGSERERKRKRISEFERRRMYN
jgi:hypothetical protein